ncbi:MAG: Sapep family Mn(2+)-dependent dipeptidase [Clostridiales bacterium]|nr:Sapep family Mn(2+)-dependent dipeptidase [Candidatus Blautia equi]
MYREILDRYIDEHKEEMLEDVKTLVRVDSVRGEAKEGMPFGEGPAKVIEVAEKMLSGYGFKTTNYDNYVITADFNDEEKQLDILAHLDVVPVSPSDWTVTAPFEPVILDGKIYGRGTADDKGPAVAALYAMRAIRESGIQLPKNVRLILGADEECGSGDLEYYYKKEAEAPMTFTPDANFPVINIEKGRLAKEFGAEFSEEPVLPAVTAFHCGTAVNIVPANAFAVVKGLSMETVNAAIASDESGAAFTASACEDAIKIVAKGVPFHASMPDGGNNALCSLLELLGTLPLSDCPQNRTLKAISGLFPRTDYYGEALGVNIEDEVSGKLTMNLGILNYEGSTLCGQFDSRVPVCGNNENVTRVIENKFAENGLSYDSVLLTPPHYVPADSELVQALMACYENYTGIKGEPIAIGGGTYVHELERGVAFGCEMDGVDNHMHGNDEFMEIDVLVMSAKIFADAIIRLCK